MEKEPKGRKKRFYKRLLIALAIFIVLVVGSFIYIARNMKPVLSQKLKDQLVQSSDSLYHATFSDLKLNLYTGTIIIKDLRLIPDTAVYNKLKSFNIAPENIFDLSVQQLELRHAHPFKLFFKKTVQIKEIRINQPILKIYHQELIPNDTTQSLETMMRNLLNGPLKSIYVGRIGLNNISLSYKNNSNPQGKGFSLENADIVLKNLAIDPKTIKDTTRFFYSEDVWVHLTDFKMPSKNGLYNFSVKDIAYSAQQEVALIKGLSVKTGLTDDAFDKRVGIQADKIDFEADSIKISGLNILNILYRRKIGEIKSIGLSDGKFNVYRNRALPEKKSLKPLPQEMLRNAGKSYLMKTISTMFILDTLHIHNIDVTYREHNPKSLRTGQVSFENLGGTLYNIANDSLHLIKSNHLKADLHAMFMGKSQVKVHFDFNLTDPADRFSYSGHLGSLKATALNVATRNLGLVSIKSGNIDKLDLNFNADNNRAIGTVTLLYEDLNIKLLALDEATGLLKNKGVASLLANVLVLKNNNTDDPDAMRQTSVNYERDQYKSMFNLMWKSVFEGVKTILGMDKESNNKLKKSLKGNKLLEKIKEHKKNK